MAGQGICVTPGVAMPRARRRDVPTDLLDAGSGGVSGVKLHEYLSAVFENQELAFQQQLDEHHEHIKMAIDAMSRGDANFWGKKLEKRKDRAMDDNAASCKLDEGSGRRALSPEPAVSRVSSNPRMEFSTDLGTVAAGDVTVEHQSTLDSTLELAAGTKGVVRVQYSDSNGLEEQVYSKFDFKSLRSAKIKKEKQILSKALAMIYNWHKKPCIEMTAKEEHAQEQEQEKKGRELLTGEESMHAHSLVEQIEIIEDKMMPWSAFLEKKLSSPTFDVSVGLAICANSIIMFLQAEQQGAVAGVALGMRDIVGWDHSDIAFVFFEHAFNVLFSLELILRVYAFKCRFFFKAANLFDAFLVLSGLVDSYIVGNVFDGPDLNVSFARMFRVFRLVRVLRIVRVMHAFRELRILVKTIYSSVRALLWSMVLLSIVMAISALFLCQLLDDYIADEDNPMETRLWVYKRYGSASRASWTMFELTLSGGWPNYARPLVEDVSPYLAIYFGAYVSVVTFAMIRIITAIFLQQTFQVAGHDQEMIQMEAMKKKNQYIEKLRDVFEKADESGDGMVSKAEFNKVLQLEEVRKVLRDLEMDPHEAHGLFALIDDGDGNISFEEFLSGTLRLKGSAKSVDVIALLYENQKTAKKLNEISMEIEALCLEENIDVHKLRSEYASASSTSQSED